MGPRKRRLLEGERRLAAEVARIKELRTVQLELQVAIEQLLLEASKLRVANELEKQRLLEEESRIRNGKIGAGPTGRANDVSDGRDDA